MSPDVSKFIVEPGKTAKCYTIANCGLYKSGKSHFEGTMPAPGFIQVDPNRDIGYAKGHGVVDYSGGEPPEIWEDWSRRVLPALFNRQPEVIGLPKDIQSICLDCYTFLFEVILQLFCTDGCVVITHPPDSLKPFLE